MGEIADRISDSYERVLDDVTDWLQSELGWVQHRDEDHRCELFLVAQDRVIAFTELAFWATQSFSPTECDAVENAITDESNTDTWYSPVTWDAVPMSEAAAAAVEELSGVECRRVHDNDYDDACAPDGEGSITPPTVNALVLPEAWFGYAANAHGKQTA